MYEQVSLTVSQHMAHLRIGDWAKGKGNIREVAKVTEICEGSGSKSMSMGLAASIRLVNLSVFIMSCFKMSRKNTDKRHRHNSCD